MPVPGGAVTVEYNRGATGIDAEVTLPQGMTGTLLWLGRKTKLQGHQKLRLRLDQQ